MKPQLLVDTNFFCALYNSSDALHQQAKTLAPTLNDYKLVTSNFILLETYTVLSQRTSKVRAIAFGVKIRKELENAIYWIKKRLEDETWKVFTLVKDKNFSYVDASILALLKKEKIHYLLSFDQSFKKFEDQFGFKLIH